MVPAVLAEVDLLRLQLASEAVARAEAELRAAKAERGALLTTLCAQYGIDPKTQAIDLATGAIVAK